MKNIILFENSEFRKNLLPLTFTRPIADLRVGILKIWEKWEKYTHSKISFLTEDYLSEKYALTVAETNLYINGSVCPNRELIQALEKLETNQYLTKNGVLIAHYDSYLTHSNDCEAIMYDHALTVIAEKHDIFVHNGHEIKNDFVLVTNNRQSEPITDKYTAVYNEDQIFIEEGVVIKAAVLNAEAGPIYIGKNSEIKEGALIRGPFALLDHSMVNLGSKIQGDTTIGPYSKVGGEISNSVILGYTNKVHDGFIGNTVLGEWCNLGADTNTSNLKNNYSHIKVWNYKTMDYENTKRQFHGLIMGDYSKAGINTMFNTGTVVGVSANIFGAGFPDKFLKSFTWGGCENTETFKFEQAIEAIQRVYERRNLQLDECTLKILKRIYQLEQNA
ncbi:MAG: putative sugar nucleotidyl transferase [Cytophagales bacterium]